MCNKALFTPKHATLETVRTVGTLLLTISTSNLAGFAFFNGQHINQAVQVKTGGKIFQITTIRHSANSLAFRASDCVSTVTWSVPVFQALQTETVKTWEVLWICVYVSTHWTRNFFTKIVKQRFDIHGWSVVFWGVSENSGLNSRKLTRNNDVPWLCFHFLKPFSEFVMVAFPLHQPIRDPCL